jgi:hypothetical protein
MNQSSSTSAHSSSRPLAPLHLASQNLEEPHTIRFDDVDAVICQSRADTVVQLEFESHLAVDRQVGIPVAEARAKDKT